MAVDQAGHGNHAGAIDDGLGLLLGSFLGDGGDFALGDANIGGEQHIHLGIHGHNRDIRDQSIQ